MTHYDLEDGRHLSTLPNSAIAVIDWDEFFNASWYWKNWVNSSIETVANDGLGVSAATTTWA